ncbi:MAG TPA: hypothetical protein VME41_15845 [Stellaceae bacterium]|nr:hypothetical protein [Stellaceae bacterium]
MLTIEPTGATASGVDLARPRGRRDFRILRAFGEHGVRRFPAAVS